MGLTNNANSSDQQVTNEVKLYKGITNGKIVAINPNLAQLKELGFNSETEPVYDLGKDEEGNQKIAIDFYLEFEKLNRPQKLRFFLTENFRISGDKVKRQLIDKTGKTGWDTMEGTCERLEWIDSESVRPCYVGEDLLTDFLINWLNIKPGDEARLENPANLFKLDLKELKDAWAAFKNNEVRVMLIVKHSDEGKNYQNVYDRYFDRATNTSYTYWEKHINKRATDGYPITASFSYEFEEYKPESPTGDVNTESKKDKKDEDLF